MLSGNDVWRERMANDAEATLLPRLDQLMEHAKAPGTTNAAEVFECVMRAAALVLAAEPGSRLSARAGTKIGGYLTEAYKASQVRCRRARRRAVHVSLMTLLWHRRRSRLCCPASTSALPRTWTTCAGRSARYVSSRALLRKHAWSD
jgi:hypothetical protein